VGRAPGPPGSAPFPSGRETTSGTFLNYTLVSSGNHIQKRAHTGDFTMDAAGRAFGPTRAAPGIRKPKLRAHARKAELIESDVEMSRCFRWRCGPSLASLLQISHHRTTHSICLLFTFRFCSALIILVVRH